MCIGPNVDVVLVCYAEAICSHRFIFLVLCGIVWRSISMTSPVDVISENKYTVYYIPVDMHAC